MEISIELTIKVNLIRLAKLAAMVKAHVHLKANKSGFLKLTGTITSHMALVCILISYLRFKIVVDMSKAINNSSVFVGEIKNDHLHGRLT